MTQTDTDFLAIAFIDGSDTWTWYLKIDDIGLHRWYLQRDIRTNLRAATRDDAEARLRRFAEQSLRGELVIVGTEYPGTAED